MEYYDPYSLPKDKGNTESLSSNEVLEEVLKRNNPMIQAHSARVANIGLSLSKDSPNTNKDAIIHGALFHDISYKMNFLNHAKEGAEIFVRDFARYYNKKIAEIIKNAIASHSLNSEESINSLEAAIVNDADKIDCVASLIPKMYSKTLERLNDTINTQESCRLQIMRLFESLVTENGKEMFINTLTDQKEIHPWLAQTPILHFKNFVLV